MKPSSDEDPQHIFVYGTLRTAYSRLPASVRSLRPPQVLQQSDQWVGTALLDGFLLYDLGDYPGVVRAKNDLAAVVGDVFRVDPVELDILDIYEGISSEDLPPQEYERIRVVVRLSPGAENERVAAGNAEGVPTRQGQLAQEVLSCWLYLYKWGIPPGAVHIKSGDYVEYCANRLKQ